jgi:hypothetical protein
MIALARASGNCKRQNSPAIRDGALHQLIRNSLTVTKIRPWAPDGCLTPRQTGRLTVCRNMTLSLTLMARQRQTKILVMDIEETEDKNDCAGEG